MTIFRAGLAAISLLFAGSAAAHTDTVRILSDRSNPSDTVRVAVSAADLDLTTERGRRILKVRIYRAARDVCGLDTGNRILDRYSRCLSDTVERTKPQIAQLIGRAMAGAAAGGAVSAGAGSSWSPEWKAELIPAYRRGACSRCPAP
ncbi:hypothetical protein DMC47_25495 [Nostoc sp. 3335mG]|nr:hypothetical protein DMC47_25495 [Nostoc sp. 3335mG]